MKFFKKLDRKGFTLAEMLIVMAVVVVLAAATIPSVGKQIEGARESNDLAAFASAYTEAYTEAAGKVAASATALSTTYGSATITLTQHQDNWQTLTAPKVGGASVPTSGVTSATNKTVYFKFTVTNDKLTLDTDGITFTEPTT